MVDSEWLTMFLKFVVHRLTMEEFDHAPILIRTNGEEEIFNIPFLFFPSVGDR